MPDRYSDHYSDRGYSRGYDDRRPSSTGYRSGAPRSGASRTSSSGYRSSSARPSNGSYRGAPSRPSNGGSRGSYDRRPPQGRRPAPRRRKRGPNRAPIAIAALIVLVLLVVIINPFASHDTNTPAPMSTPVPQQESGTTANNAVAGTNSEGFNNAVTENDAPVEPAATHASLAAALADEDAEVAKLDSSEQVKTKDLMINSSLPNTWTNILLLGTDERNVNDSARTDAMMICSINNSTGEIKLASIMRDAAFKMNVGSKYDGTYRINSANYFGGPEYAMRVVNENLGMNIQYYVAVNFYGFSKIASALGGVDIDITEAEMNEINKRAIEQARSAYKAGVDESDLEAAGENVLLETFGPNTHLNGRQTLAYARIRKLDSDASRTERQRTVMEKMFQKLKTKSIPEVLQLGTTMFGYVSTNLSLETMLTVATNVLQNSNFSGMKTLRLPETGTYKQETRNEQSMLYDVDWQTNANILYNFIYAS